MKNRICWFARRLCNACMRVCRGRMVSWVDAVKMISVFILSNNALSRSNDASVTQWLACRSYILRATA